jgi:4-amino-4-deoxy-L-arabinose transferase-like glycosyltransferase
MGVRDLPLVIILLIAAGLRLWGLNDASLWYDEVITMQVARADGLASLVERLDRLDGTRAPLYPLVLRAWLRAFGPTDLAGRSFSVVCGVATIAMVFLLARDAFDVGTALWSAWLAAVCPPLVYYSQEARMYAWLVLLTCLSWLAFFRFRREASPLSCLCYGLLLVSLAYSHPLGLFMIAAHGLAYLVVRRSLMLSARRWLLIQLGAVLAVVPWVPRYLDHGTDYPLPRYSLRFLLAVPIEYIGGNGWVLAICLAIIVVGLYPGRTAAGSSRLAIASPVENLIFIAWAAVPPILMYLYSALFEPVFGPPRYHLFIAPAYLILLAHGLTRLPAAIRWPAVAAGLALALGLVRTYSPVQKADWRGFAAWLSERHAQEIAERIIVVVHPGDPRFRREQLEVARYYLEPRFRVVPAGEAIEPARIRQDITYEVVCRAQPPKGATPRSGSSKFYGLNVRELSIHAPGSRLE